MKRVSIAAFTLLLVSSASFAQTAVQPPISHRAIQRAALRKSYLHPADRYVRNANNCGGELSRVVWGRNGSILGYGCYRDSN